VAGQYDRATIGVMAVAVEKMDLAQQLRGLADQVADKVTRSPRHWSYKIPRLAWQVSLGLALAFLVMFPGGFLGAATNQTVGTIATVIGVLFLVIYFIALPEFHRRTRARRLWRDGLLSGDYDGTVRCALQSVGIDLPDNNK
jgi:hypothetical protein